MEVILKRDGEGSGDDIIANYPGRDNYVINKQFCSFSVVFIVEGMATMMESYSPTTTCLPLHSIIGIYCGRDRYSKLGSISILV